MGSNAIIVKLPYAIAIPSGVLLAFAVPFTTFSVKFSVACATTILTTSAIFQTGATATKYDAG